MYTFLLKLLKSSLVSYFCITSSFNSCFHCFYFNSQQISGSHSSRNYPSSKIEEFKSRVDQLKREHNRYVRKVRALDPSYEDITPWELRGYRRKRSLEVRKLGLPNLKADTAAKSEAPVERTLGYELEPRCEMEKLGEARISYSGKGEKEKTDDVSIQIGDTDVSSTSSAASEKESSAKSSGKEQLCPNNLAQASSATQPQTYSAGLRVHCNKPLASASSNLLQLDYSSSSSDDTYHEEDTNRKQSKLSEQDSVQ